MTASAVYGDGLTLSIANPLIGNPRTRSGKETTIIDHKLLATTSIDEVGDKIHLALIPSNAVVIFVGLVADDLDSHSTPTLAYDVGCYYFGDSRGQKALGKARGDVVDVDAIASAVTVGQSAATTWQDVTFEARNIDTAGTELWSVCGLSSDPGGHFMISLTITAVSATPAAGDVSIKVSFL